MILDAKLSKKNNPAKSSAKKVKNPEKQQSVEDKVLKEMSISQKKAVINTALEVESVNFDLDDGTEEYLGNELYTLRYDINERGIGKILLPPSLSTLLQSDRVCISPTAGGLFIKSL